MSTTAVPKHLFRVEMLKSDEKDENGDLNACTARIAADDIFAALQRGEEMCRKHGWMKTVLIEQEATIEVV